MCNTLEINLHLAEVQDHLNAKLSKALKWYPRYYASAFDLPEVPVLDYTSTIVTKHWGLIPFWVKDRLEAEKVRFKAFLARGETVDTKQLFREAFQQRRCLMIASGFFEWQHRGREKIPHYIYPKERQPLTVAAIHERWTDRETGEIIETCAMITTEANAFWGEIHNSQKRMPVIVESQDRDAWLNPGTKEDGTKALLRPCPEELLTAHTISKLISRRGAEKNVPELVEKYEYGMLF